MSRDKRSRTAQGVLAERAVLADMGVISDPFARGMLAPSWKAYVGLVEHWPGGKRPWAVARVGLGTRLLWHDAQLVTALDAGIRQVAVIGAGYDSRAWRFHRDGVQFFELDHGATQRDKERRAPGPGPTYVAADLTVQSAAAALHAGGLDASRPAHFILEGVTMYLGESGAREQLRELAQSSAVGSRITLDFSPPPDAGTAQDRRQVRFQRLARTGSGEIFRLTVDRPQASALVEATGWHITEATGVREVARALIPRESGLPIDAINEHRALVAGERMSS